MTSKTNCKLDAATLGKIVFARFLSLPLKTYDRCVEKTEASPCFQILHPYVKASVLDRAVLYEDSPEYPSVSAGGLGEICLLAGRPEFVYYRPSFVREYHLDESAIGQLRQAHALSRKLAATIHRLHLINHRNRMTHALIRTLLDVQADYLMSGDPMTLAALPQIHMVRILLERADLLKVADASRLSRLVRGLSFRMADGKLQPLSTLFPSERLLNCHRVDVLIKREKSLLMEGRIEHPLSDAAIAALLAQQWGVSLSRRSVTAVRHYLAIPDRRRRAGKEDYLAATEGFSPLLLMTQQSVSGSIPSHPGVYEIRSSVLREETDPQDAALAAERTRIVYIGSTRNLRKRLADHLRCNNGNVLLSDLLAGGGARVRYRAVSTNWRLLERQLYHAFCETFGAPPPCNRMSP
ncbi:GIY-YIG nuclease family protein [Methylomicrobium agile]|uniref:GIY-YIG nuclease family protein n=1 Tax=Methylomicrobium agile TaxID=39774 RepID=UPI0004DF1817|nr:GIY-YIG nuclease family protein [Methylomicrobium agile]